MGEDGREEFFSGGDTLRLIGRSHEIGDGAWRLCGVSYTYILSVFFVYLYNARFTPYSSISH